MLRCLTRRGALLPIALVAVVLVASTDLLLRHGGPAERPLGEVVVASLDELPPGRVVETSLVVPSSAVRHAQALEGRPMLGGSAIGAVYLGRDPSGRLRAFIGIDPRNGCAAEWRPKEQLFADRCHGSRYDLAGDVVAGPSPYGLSEFRVSVRDSNVYVDARRIILGPCRICAPR